jgi:DNA-binding response OmpR family regulator
MKPPQIDTGSAGIVRLLSVSPIAEDHACLEDTLNYSGAWSLHRFSRWVVFKCHTLRSALRVMRYNRFPIVVCERDLAPGTWRDLLQPMALLADPPFLMVTSRLADERLWEEALNLGAYDVLAKPFEKNEVVRVLSLARLHWVEKRRPGAAMRAVS